MQKQVYQKLIKISGLKYRIKKKLSLKRFYTRGTLRSRYKNFRIC